MMRILLIVLYFLTLGQHVSADSHLTSNTGLSVWAMCGASQGQGYYFKDDFMNPDGPNWTEDGISDGQITLVENGDQFDILFGDVAGATGYVQDGAQVILLHLSDKYIRVGAFHNNYADIYNFDRQTSEVVWSSNKSGPITGKVSVYVAKCRFVN